MYQQKMYKYNFGYQSFYSPTNAQVIVLKNVKIYIKIAPTCFDTVTPSSGSFLLHVF